MSREVNNISIDQHGILIDQKKFKKTYCRCCGSTDLILRLSTDDYSRSEYKCNKCGSIGPIIYNDVVDELEGLANKRNPYVNSATEAYVAAVNILAVEFLVKTRDLEKYTRYYNRLNELDENKLYELYVLLSINMHTSTLGAMITQGDYDIQKGALFNYLEAGMVKCPNCGKFSTAEYYGSLKKVKYYRCSCCANKFVIADEK